MIICIFEKIVHMEFANVADVKELFQKPNLAFVIGNGIHRYIDGDNCSWDNFLSQVFNNTQFPQNGLTYTEYYDIMSINTHSTSDIIKSNICDSKKTYFDCYETCANNNVFTTIIDRIKSIPAPILTTNFDLSIEKCANLNPFHVKTNFSAYYPWSEYFAKKVNSEFRVWHIHGHKNRYRSIRLGLTDYAGAIEKARKLIFADKPDSLYFGKNQNNWVGHNTWLHLMFNKSLFIFGIGLNEQEILLRWLLIVRKSYFDNIGSMHQSWYVCCKEDMNDGKRLFLESVGVETIILKDRKDIMENIWK